MDRISEIESKVEEDEKKNKTKKKSAHTKIKDKSKTSVFDIFKWCLQLASRPFCHLKMRTIFAPHEIHSAIYVLCFI